MHTSGKKEIVEAVVIAALTTLVTGLVNIGLHAAYWKYWPDADEEDEDA